MDNPLIQVAPGLMIWTLICFGITFFVLKKYAFGPIQNAIDQRRERIRQSIEEAERARSEARRLLAQGGVKLDGETVTDVEVDVQRLDGVLVQAGKRRFARIFLSGSTA